MKTILIGSGAGTETDRLLPALDLIERGNLNYIAFECMAERTIALAQQRKIEDPNTGYNRLLEYRMEKVLPIAFRKKVKVISNMGNANVEKAVEITTQIARKLGLNGIKIAGVIGDDITREIDRYYDFPILENPEKKLRDYIGKIVSANVYLGTDGIVEALRNNADVIITGRCTDPALFMAPVIYEFGWNSDDQLAACTLLGHLLECAGQVTGGYYSVPGKINVNDLWNLSFPIAEVSDNGDIIITKLPGSGGQVDCSTCTEQVLYEIHDPSNYVTADVIADFSKVVFKEIAPNRVLAKGAVGQSKTPNLKVSVGYKDSFVAITEASYGGSGCLERGKHAIKLIKERMTKMGYDEFIEEWREDILGVNSLFETWLEDHSLDYPEIRVRVSGRISDKAKAKEFLRECASLENCGPAGGGAFVRTIKDVTNIISILIPREDVSPFVIYEIS
jgi:hypothetical protein